MNLKTYFSEAFGRARNAVRRARLSVAEIAFLGAALIFASGVALFYSYKVLPLGYMVAARQRQIKDLKTQIEKLNTEEKKRLAQASNAEKILESLDGFESRLTPDERGMTQIINEIDALSTTHKVLAGDSNYRPEAADEPQFDEKGNPKPRPNRDKRPKIYPNLGVETTVLGDYSNLRRFLSDLERSRQFLIVNSLTFQGGDDRITRQLAKGGKQPQLSSAESVPVSLKIEFDTYFKPPAAGAATAQITSAAPKNSR
jgi:Type II secretion system (T2SS), protein M subtype b